MEENMALDVSASLMSDEGLVRSTSMVPMSVRMSRGR